MSGSFDRKIVVLSFLSTIISEEIEPMATEQRTDDDDDNEKS